MMKEKKDKHDWEKISLHNFVVILGKVCTFLVTVDYHGYLNIYKSILPSNYSEYPFPNCFCP